MSEEDNYPENDEMLPIESELDVLKQRARQMGVQFSSNIGVDTLRDRVAAASEGTEAATVFQEPIPLTPVTALPDFPVQETEGQRRQRLKLQANQLWRVRIACMNPNRRDHDGEIFTAGNGVVGTFRRMVPFNEDWHVPGIILNMIEDRQCQIFTNVTGPKGQKSRVGKLVKEFSVDRLDALTEEEIKDLAQRQAMASGTPA
tara:strand:+ start:5883 stop:6488 length:606 start_codon:yes stop_codon:yes gene_type:complete